MLELVTKTAKLIPYPKRNKAVPGFATAYYYEPQPGPESELGSLFIVLEILAPPKQAEEVAELVIRSVGEGYYNAGGDPEPSRRFEAAIKTANNELGDYTDKGNGSWVGRMSSIIAVVVSDKLHLTQTGSAEAHLYRKGTSNLISQGLGPTGPHRPRNTFAQFASGQLESGDRLLLTTPALLHNLSNQKLQTLVSDNSPAAAAQEISELTKDQEQSERVAALLMEVTTPDRLAMQVIPDEPGEVQVGSPDSLLGVAKETATPAIRQSAKVAHHAARKGADFFSTSIQPRIRQSLMWLVQRLRRILSRPGGSRYLAVATVALLVLIGYWWHASTQAAQLKHLQSQFSQASGLVRQSEDSLAAGDKAAASKKLAQAKTIADQLAKSSQEKQLDTQLAKMADTEGDPQSVSALESTIQSEQDVIDNVVPATLSSLSDLSGVSQKPDLVATAGSKLLLAAAEKSNLAVYDTSTSQLSTINTPSGFGKTVALTAGSSGSEAYILTDAPAVWLYSSADNSLTKLSASGGWAAGTAIASYAGNLYVLSSEQVWRYTPTAAGFSARTGYVTDPATAKLLTNATALAVDGSVLVGGGQPPLVRLMSGKVEEKANDLPSNLGHPKVMQSLNDGSLIFESDSSSNRLGLVGFDGRALNYFRQYSLDSVNRLQAATVASDGKTVYILADGKLWKFSLSL